MAFVLTGLMLHQDLEVMRLLMQRITLAHWVSDLYAHRLLQGSGAVSERTACAQRRPHGAHKPSPAAGSPAPMRFADWSCESGAHFRLLLRRSACRHLQAFACLAAQATLLDAPTCLSTHNSAARA